MPAIPRTVSLPLFDRLSVREFATSRPHTDALALDAIAYSVQRDLERLLSCRSRLTFDAFLSDAASVLDYGIPDSSALTMASLDDRARLGAAITRAISLFEPRLRNVEVTVEPFPANNVDALVYIDGELRAGDARHRAAFALTSTGAPAPSSARAPRSDTALARHPLSGVVTSGAGR